jgi:hypothetical protein
MTTSAPTSRRTSKRPRRPGHRGSHHRRARGRDPHPPGPGAAGKGRRRTLGRIASGTSCRGSSRTTPTCATPSGRQRKIIIFSEHRDTLNYLQAQDRRRPRQPRRHRHHPRRHAPRRAPPRPGAVPLRPGSPRVLVATDAAGRRREPPERQPDGQLRPAVEPEPPGAALRPHPPHRPAEVCHLWNLVAKETREGEVYHRCSRSWRRERGAQRAGLRHPRRGLRGHSA